MLNIWTYSLLSVLIVSLLSLVGVLTFPIKKSQLENWLVYMVGFSAGAFLGDVFIHLLPEVTEKVGFTLDVSLYILFGIVVSFLIEKVIHFRHAHISVRHHYHPTAIMSLVGDTLHNFIDGVIIATSYLVSIPVGIVTTIAVVFHEIPQEIGNFGVLLYGGLTKKRALLFNFLTGLTAVLGAIIALAIQVRVESAINFFIPFTVGNFIYIAGSDLIPELHKEVDFRKSIMQFVFLMLGIGAMALLIYL